MADAVTVGLAFAGVASSVALAAASFAILKIWGDYRDRTNDQLRASTERDQLKLKLAAAEAERDAERATRLQRDHAIESLSAMLEEHLRGEVVGLSDEELRRRINAARGVPALPAAPAAGGGHDAPGAAAGVRPGPAAGPAR